jgi:succinate-semialdehyde dehydrogenase/glutarate-semialdehyde dehydrogenase
MATVTASTNVERLYLAGEWVETGDSFEVRSPHSGEVVATIARAGADEARRAIDAAERAMQDRPRLAGASVPARRARRSRSSLETLLR